jgi:hypothetical protein
MNLEHVGRISAVSFLLFKNFDEIFQTHSVILDSNSTD